jgi:hypothetical protein
MEGVFVTGADSFLPLVRPEGNGFPFGGIGLVPPRRIAPIPLFHVRRRVKWFNHAVPDAVRRVREKYTTRNGRDSI